MAREQPLVFALNAGGIDPDMIARVDLDKTRLAGEHPVAEWLPSVLGPMSLRPGTEMLTRIPGDARTRQIPVVPEVGGGYVLLVSAGEIRISQDGVIQQVPAVGTRIAVEELSTEEAGIYWFLPTWRETAVSMSASPVWIDVSTLPATASGDTTLTFAATATASARLRQAVTVAAAVQATVHILRVVVSRGPVFLRVGTTAGGQELIADARLDTGTHKIGFIPNAATIYVEFRADDAVTRTISEVQFESALLAGGTGDLVLPSPWSTTASIDALRWWRSERTLFVGDGLVQQRKIEIYGAQSIAISLYESEGGPFVSGSDRIGMTPGALSGNTTLTASSSYFRTGHVGALIELTQTGKTVEQTFDAVDLTSDYITVTGLTGGRDFYITGTASSFVGTVVLERSFDPGDPLIWSTYQTYVDGAANFARTLVNDGQTNITIHYRFRSSAYTSGSVDMVLEYQSGVQIGRGRITGYTSPTVVNVEVSRNFGNLVATRQWRIGDWSDVRGWPRTPIIVDDRMSWFRSDRHYGSQVGDYYTFDDEAEGDAATFTRTVGGRVLWALPIGQLVIGTMEEEAKIASGEFDEGLTPTRYTVRKFSRRGSMDLAAVEHDDGGCFAQRSERRLYDISSDGQRFVAEDVSRYNPAAYQAGIVGLAIQQQPTQRRYSVLADGTVTVLTFERNEKVVAVTTLTIDGGLIEDLVTVAERDQDDVYLIVNRNGQRYQERLAKEAAQRDVDTCTLLDGHRTLTGSIAQITGATHLAGRTVAVWADGQRRRDVTLSASGTGTLDGTYARVVYGTPYTARFKSSKLSYAATAGTAVAQIKQIRHVGLILADSVLDGVTVGRAGSDLGPLSPWVSGAARAVGDQIAHYDEGMIPIYGDWSTDERFVIEANSADGPVTVQAVVMDIETRDGGGPARGR